MDKTSPATDEASRFRKLRLYNAVMGAFHLAQAAAVLVMSKDFRLPVNTSFLNFVPETESLQPVTETLIRLPIGPLVAVFLLLSAVAHFTLASPRVFDWYVGNLKKGINYAR